MTKFQEFSSVFELLRCFQTNPSTKEHFTKGELEKIEQYIYAIVQ